MSEARTLKPWPGTSRGEWYCIPETTAQQGRSDRPRTPLSKPPIRERRSQPALPHALALGFSPPDADPSLRRGRQPLIENAVRHGVAANANSSWLEVKTRRTGDSLAIEVSNSAGAAVDGEKGFGIGLKNTSARLEQLYGPCQQMSVRRLPDRFELSLTLPWRAVNV
jgi:hypothetical protein